MPAVRDVPLEDRDRMVGGQLPAGDRVSHHRAISSPVATQTSPAATIRSSRSASIAARPGVPISSGCRSRTNSSPSSRCAPNSIDQLADTSPIGAIRGLPSGIGGSRLNAK